MADRTPRSRQYVDPDGVRTTEPTGIRSGVWLLALAIALVGVAVFVVIRPAFEPAPTPPPEMRPSALGRNVPAQPAPAGRPKAAGGTPASINGPRVPSAEPEHERQPPAAQPQPVQESQDAPPAPSEADAEQTQDEPSGIAVFPPPGTKPIKRGIIVPEDFELPPGYVRHYQTTDDGRHLPAILMFHPDYHPVDERGEPIPLPEDRVVPAEMAPPGIPAQMLELSENGEPLTGLPEAAGPGRQR